MTLIKIASFGQRHKTALVIVLIALVLRLTFVLVLDPSPNFKGGDTNWYMQKGRTLVTTGKTAGPLPTAPLYLIFLGGVQALVPGHPSGADQFTTAEMHTVRVIQSFLGAALCFLVYEIARRWFSQRVGWVVAIILAISPALVIEAGNILTEQLFLFLVFGGLAWYAACQDLPHPRDLIGVGVIFGLATLTRAVFLLFPVLIAVHLLLEHRARWRRLAAALLASYSLVISTWTIYNWLQWQRLIIGAEGLLSFVYQGTEGQTSPQEMDMELDVQLGDDPDERDDKLRSRIKENILQDPVGWAGHRAQELGKAYLQPHNTTHYGGDSVRYAAQDWLRDDRSPGGLVDVVQMNAFWPKLALYVFHFGGLLLGTAGMMLVWRRWRALLPLYGIIMYFTGVHLIMLALPRYLFPVYPAFWIFAVGFMIWAWDQWQAKRRLKAEQTASTTS